MILATDIENRDVGCQSRANWPTGLRKVALNTRPAGCGGASVAQAKAITNEISNSTRAYASVKSRHSLPFHCVPVYISHVIVLHICLCIIYQFCPCAEAPLYIRVLEAKPEMVPSVKDRLDPGESVPSRSVSLNIQLSCLWLIVAIVGLVRYGTLHSEHTERKGYHSPSRKAPLQPMP